MEETDIKQAGASPTLEVNITRQDNVLQLEYKVKNTRQKPIYLFNVLWDFDQRGNYVAAPYPVYSCLRQNGELHLAKRILPLPRRRKVELRIVPFVTKVEAGKEYSETITLPLPIQEYNPYYIAEGDVKYENRVAETIVFSLQFISETEGLEVAPAQLSGALRVDHPNLFGVVETLESKPKSLAVAVNKRLDEFEEF